MAGLQLSGLSSGIDWKSIVDQLMSVEQAPVTRLQTEKATNEKRASALSTLETKFSSLYTAANALSVSGLYSRRSTTFGTSSTTWSASAADATAAGTYKFNVTQLATNSSLKGASNIGQAIAADGNLTDLTIANLPTSTAITAGSFTVNGKIVTVATSDKFEDVLARIGSLTGNDVVATYDSTNDKVKLTAASGKTIVLGATNDTSNFLQAMKLFNSDSATAISSSSALGALDTTDTLATARLNTALADQNADGTGSFSINGVNIDYDVDTDTLSTIMSRINASTAGVTAAYDSVNDSISITNTKTGDTGFSLSDTTGNLLGALGLTSASATLTRGKDALFTLNDGGVLRSSSNTITGDSSGIAGLSVTASSLGEQTITVAADTAAATTAIEDFIAKFNDVQDYIEEQTKTTTSSSGKVTTSTLTNNREVQSWTRKLRAIAFEAFSGDVDRISDMGIDFTTATNKLAIKDSSALTTALRDQSSAVNAFFTTNTTGFSARFKSYIDTTIGSGSTPGLLDNQTTSLTAANTSLDKQIADINRRLEQQRSVLESSFIAMETAQSKANNIMTQLSKSFS